MVNEKTKLNEIANKWQKVWQENKVFEANVNKNKKKFFINFAFPYVNGLAHLGHALSLIRTEVMARYKRLKGYNVLFPQGFHATGQPIVAAANLIKNGDEKQKKILISYGIPETEIENFKEPEYWIYYFSKKWKEDLKKSGCSIDFRRTFFTTELNPPFDKFIRWQYNQLNSKGYIIKGSHPVVYCPNCKYPIGDHDRKEGEGITPEEVILMKFKDKEGKIYPCMTFRPETVYGVTNIWLNPNEKYSIVKIISKDNENQNNNNNLLKNNEIWVLSNDVLNLFEYQNYKFEIINTLNGREFIGTYLTNPVNNKEIPILPATFVDVKNGTGIVMSVPAHAPFDYIALEELKNNKEIIERYNLNSKLPKEIISLINLKGFSKFPAKDIIEKYKITSQNDPKLKEATKEIYKNEFHKGILNEIFGELKGTLVCQAKEKLIEKFLNQNIALKYYILMNKVVCRCNTNAVVSIVKDQYFLNYSNKKWKESTKKLLENMRFYPKETKENYLYTIEWLKDWACVRDKGIGTKLPWDKKWLIESLSDSTIYMAYYTIAHYLQNSEKYNINIDDLKDSLFSYIFLSEGNIEEVSKENNINPELLKTMKEEFEYWYENGFDYRSSGKDLIQNHLTFCLFHHNAIFSKNHWPSGFSVNGHMMLDGEKMSKSKGNFITFREAMNRYGTDGVRFVCAFASDSSIDDANFETKLAESINQKLLNLLEFAKNNYNKGREEYKDIDYWFENKINQIIEETDNNYDSANFKSVLQKSFFDLNNYFKWYKRRTKENYNKYTISRFIEVRTLLLSPVIPHICEEIWETIGKKKLITLETFPEIKEIQDNNYEIKENLIEKILKSIEDIIKITNKKPKTIKIYVSKDWKYDVYELAKKLDNKKDLIKIAIQEFNINTKDKFAMKYLQKLMKTFDFSKILTKESELEFLKNNIEFINKEFNVSTEILNSNDLDDEKARRAEPLNPGILIE